MSSWVTETSGCGATPVAKTTASVWNAPSAPGRTTSRATPFGTDDWREADPAAHDGDRQAEHSSTDDGNSRPSLEVLRNTGAQAPKAALAGAAFPKWCVIHMLSLAS